MTALLANLLQTNLAEQVKARGRELGFDRVGIAAADASGYRAYFRQWLSEGRHGSMHYLADRLEERTDPRVYLPGAASVICVAKNYHVQLAAAESGGVPGRIARYALGDDYHQHMKRGLHALADWLRQRAPEAQTRCCVDTAPVMEKELAARAGIGWIGKNTCVINPDIGSWVFLGSIVTTLELPSDDPAIDRCGTCRRCIDACPTQAITAPYQLDARRCISYLTIEHRGDIHAELAQKTGEWLYGCDICQDVCPWNRRAPSSDDAAVKPRFVSGALDAREVREWSDEEYRRQLRGSAMKRVKLPMLQRNAQAVMANAQKTGRATNIARPTEI